jgi:peptidoglycan biosynthesis protein MviN/MurJ (putative lipid II flippase)
MDIDIVNKVLAILMWAVIWVWLIIILISMLAHFHIFIPTASKEVCQNVTYIKGLTWWVV